MKLHQCLKGIEDRSLSVFTRWFVSEGGVYQTFLITISIVIIEALFPSVDSHGFLLLYWLTVYSAVTQPALAYSNACESAELKAQLDRLESQLHDLRAALGATA